MVGFIWRESVCVCGEWGVGALFSFLSLPFTNTQRASDLVVAFAFMLQRCGDIQTISGIL